MSMINKKPEGVWVTAEDELTQRTSAIRPRFSDFQYDELREEFTLWYFNKDREGNQLEWAADHGISSMTLSNWKKRPDFASKMLAFRETYQEDADEAFRNLLRFSVDANPKIAIPAIKLLLDAMGYNAPQKIEHSVKGLSLMQYLQMVTENKGTGAALQGLHKLAEESGMQQVRPSIIPKELN